MNNAMIVLVKVLLPAMLMTSVTASQSTTLFVNISGTAWLALSNLPDTSLIKTPSDVVIINKTGSTCSLIADSSKYSLASTDCSDTVNFVVKFIKTTDAGYYTATGTDSKQLLVVLGKPKKPVIHPSIEDVRLGNVMTLTCITESTTLPANHDLLFTYKWYKNGANLSQDSRVLQVPSVQLSDFNTSYICSARENFGEASSPSDEYLLRPKYRNSFDIRINGISNSEPEVVLRAGQELEFECIGDAYPVFHKMGISGIGLEQNTNYFSYNTTVECSNSMTLKCQGWHILGYILSHRVKIQVTCPPNLSESMKTPVVIFNTEYFKRDFVIPMVGFPPPTFTVKRITTEGFEPFPLNYEIQPYDSVSCKLIFYNYNWKSYGSYQLVAKNSEGTFVTNFTVLGPPQPPTNPLAWSTTPNSAHLSWRSSDSYGEVQEFVVYRREESDVWKVYDTYVDSGTKITITVTSLKENTFYAFMIQSRLRIRHDRPGFFSGVASTRTIKKGDAPQTEPTVKEPVLNNSTGSTTPPSRCPEQASLKEPWRFETGIGIGIVIGVVCAALVTIVFLYIKKKMDEARYSKPEHQPYPTPDYLSIYGSSTSTSQSRLSTATSRPSVSSSGGGNYLTATAQ